MSTSHEQLLKVINEFFDNGGNREDFFERMQDSSLDRETLGRVINVARLYKNNYFSRRSKIKRFLQIFFTGKEDRAEVIF